MREMKDSGVEWIGEIPKEWKMGFIKNGYKIILGKMLSPTQTQSNQSLENYISAINIKWDGIDTSTQKQMWFSKDEKKEYLLKSGDILITEGGLAGTSCKYNNEFAPCYIQNSVHCCRAKKGYINKFLYYWMNIVVHCGFINSICNKATIVHYTKEKVMNTPFIIVPYEKQKTIAEFLDQKCSEIDAITNDIQAQIDTLEQYKRSVITEAVTKGLDPDVEMKDSGIEWIGEIPKHWSIIKTRYIVIGIYDLDHYMPKSTESGIPYLMTGDLKNRISEVDFNLCKQVSLDDYVILSRKKKIKKGDIIFARYATIGTVCYVDNDEDFLVSYSCAIIEPDSKLACPKYVFYYMKSTAYLTEITRLSNENTQSNIGKESMYKAKICLPPIEDQVHIATFLDSQISEIDKVISSKQEQLSTLSDYKKSLIYEYVTGKKEVPVE